MPLFLSEEEFRLCAHDASLLAERADAFIIDLRRQLDTVRAEADAASIASEQTCALLEQKYAALSSDLSRLQAENGQLAASAEQHLSELAEARAQKHQLHLKAIGKDGEIERLNMQVSELHKSKRQLLELLAQRDVEINERNATIQSYLEKIVDLTDSTSSKAAIIHENEAELSRCRAACDRLSQEKALIEKHNAWLDEELNTKVNSLIELRKKHMDVEVDMAAKVADLEKQLDDSSNLYKRSKDRVLELEGKLTSLEEEVHLSKDSAAANEERFSAELSTVTRLVELHKASSDEWSKKAGELEGVIKALETHLNQVENDYKEKLEKEVSLRKDYEKEIASLKDKLEKCEVEIENGRKATELSLLPISSFQVDSSIADLVNDKDEVDGDNQHMIVPRIPTGISGTALAASLLRDGWSLAKMYVKYQETADALRHEKWGRKHSEAILERVLHEIEEKAELILEERAEHERMLEAYSLMDQRLQQALLEKDNFENTLRKLKSELKRGDRDYTIAEKEIGDLQKQVTVLLKECQDVQLRGATSQSSTNNSVNVTPFDIDAGLDIEAVISEHLLTFRDINGLVEQNVKLRKAVHILSSQVENNDSELKEGLQMELQKVIDEASAKVEAVLKRSEEQGHMIESLHSSVAMYKRLYEEERKLRASSHSSLEPLPDGRKDLVLLLEGSQEVSKKAHEELADRARILEDELTKMRSEVTSLRLERDKMSLEANFVRERFDGLLKNTELQRQEANAVSARNVELTHLLVEYQKRVRESSDALNAVEENSRKLSMEISILKHEKEILSNSEKRASAEVCSLSERVHRLQSSLDTIQSTEEIRENARAAEKRKLEEHLKRIERDWADAKRELQEERDHVRALTQDKEIALNKSMAQVGEISKELADAWRAVASAESRAAVAEARCSDLEAKINISGKKAIQGLHEAEDVEKLKEEAEANKNYMLQYKEIAQTNEEALKQIECAHEEYKAEAERLKKALEAEVLSLRNKISEIESFYVSKSEEANRAMEDKEKALSSTLAEKSNLNEEIAEKLAQIGCLEVQVSSLSDDLEKEHKRWRTAQDNYERQVILQSETIQELTNTSKELSRLQEEVSKLQEFSEAQKIENDLLKSSGEKEKLVLQELKDEAERKYNELNEQNKILHNRLESLHVRLADREQKVSSFGSQNIDSQTDSDVQTVLNYLRRSKEIAETEMSLLKQEKFRLQSQLESALKASETAQTLLNSQLENSRAAVLNEEEFKSLQFQVREINLLRESNMQLREENKHNFEESQKFREESQKAKVETEKISTLLREKQIELDSCQKVVEMQNVEIGHLQSRIAELHENCKNIDVGEYERMKDDLHQLKIRLAESDTQLHLTNNLVSEKQELISSLEENLAKCQSKLAEQEKKLADALQAEANIRQENEKQRKIINHWKKKHDILLKEKEELTKENQALLKQLDDSKSSRRAIIDNASELAMKEKEEKDKEKDTRIQILEKTLERERDENKREKTKRLKTEKTMVDLVENVNKEKKKVEDELAKHKHAIVNVLENSGITASRLPDGSALDEQTSTYFQLIDNLETSAKSFLNDGLGTQPNVMETSPVDIPITTTGPVGTHQLKLASPQEGAEERDKRIVTKPITEVRKAGRKIVRPSLEWSGETSIDIEMSGVEGSATEEGRALSSHESEPSGVASVPNLPSSSRKRAAPSDETSDEVNLLKRPRESEPMQEAGDEQAPPLSAEDSNASRQLVPPPMDISDTQPPVDGPEADQVFASPTEAEIMDTGKPEEMEFSTKVEIEGQKMTLDGINQDEPQHESDSYAEDAEKARVATDSLDDALKIEGNDVLQPADDSEDAREEGELIDESEQTQQEDPSPVECAHDSISGDGGVNADETGEISEVVAVSNEKCEGTNIVEDLADTSDKPTGNNNDQNASDFERSPQPSSRAREGSPSNATASSVTEPQSAITASESEEPRTGETISQRASRNSALRRAGIAPQPPSAGRGRGASGSRGGRGTRGRRGLLFGGRKQN